MRKVDQSAALSLSHVVGREQGNSIISGHSVTSNTKVMKDIEIKTRLLENQYKQVVRDQRMSALVEANIFVKRYRTVSVPNMFAVKSVVARHTQF